MAAVILPWVVAALPAVGQADTATAAVKVVVGSHRHNDHNTDRIWLRAASCDCHVQGYLT